MQIVIYQIFPTALRLTNWKTGCKLYKYEIYPLKEAGGVAGGKHILGKAKRHIFGTAKVGEKGQIVIPKAARDTFRLSEGDRLVVLGDEEQGIALIKAEVFEERMQEALRAAQKSNE